MKISTIILAAAISAVTVSGAFARDAASEIRYVPPTVEDNASSPAPSAYQEEAVPYRPCRLALGWRNGHLVCDNIH
jgi:hypothetical protein